MSLQIVTDYLSPACNSYVTESEMRAYLFDRVSESASDQWDNLDVEVQRRYLVNATRSLDNGVTWIGDRWRDQMLAWPRVNAWYDGFYLDSNVVPKAVKEATCEQAKWAMENAGVFSVGQNAQFDSIKVGPITIDFHENVGGSKDKYFPDIVAQILEGYGEIQNPNLPGANKVKSIKLFRS